MNLGIKEVFKASYVLNPRKNFAKYIPFLAQCKSEFFFTGSRPFYTMSFSGSRNSDSQADLKQKPLSIAAVLIGNELLSGKTQDSNGSYLAKACFSLGISLKRIETIGDDAASISETINRLCNNHDIVLTSGGVGPTHDDITFEAIANAFGLGCYCDQELYKRQESCFLSMKKRDNRKSFSQKKTTQTSNPLENPDSTISSDANTQNISFNNIVELSAYELESIRRMSTVPVSSKLHYLGSEFWTPVVICRNVCIFPGSPRYFEMMIDRFFSDFKNNSLATLGSVFRNDHFVSFFTRSIHTKLYESDIFKLLETVENKYDVKIGSYPKLDSNQNFSVTLTIDGFNRSEVDNCYSELLSQLSEIENKIRN
ncbi:hypothetical protein BB560_007170 [Smittium megazygosporum]|uniref:MoaB/Mog domain-containing protein n=1 Tax=Smittium megazygosporum TaxID=133381 RepID=A0A2T9XYF4_9FUNG|nr:hypothetical protein BB560_007170 [Smittium megazygosporum]